MLMMISKTKPRSLLYIAAGGILLSLILILLVVFSDDGEEGRKGITQTAPEINVMRGLTAIPSGGEVYFDSTAVNQHSAPVTFIIHNTGTAGLIINSVALTGGDIEEFRIDASGISSPISEGDYAQFAITFSPKSMGSKTARVTIINNDPDEGEYTFALAGAPVAAAKPENVVASAEDKKITLTWSEVPGATSYHLYWANSPGVSPESGTRIADVTSPYIHSGLVNGLTYYYVVTAESPYGEGVLSAEVSARPGKTYYVDATGGDDDQDGLSPESAWKTLDKVNAATFQPGEYILFKQGEIWQGRLEVQSSGSPGNPITFGAYGKGDKPVLTGRGSVPGWDIASNWTKYAENIWYIYYGPYKIARRVWLSGIEYTKAENLADVNAIYRWYFDLGNSWLYVYAESNPASYYSSIEESMAVEGVVIRIQKQEHITVRNLDVRGGSNSIEVIGSDYITIEDCDVGWGAYMGIWVSGNYWEPDKKPSDYGVIRRCKIDSGYRLSYYYEKAHSEDGIHFRNNVNYWRVYENEIRNWGHTGVSLWQEDEQTTVSHNKIYSNFITTSDIPYGRGFEVKGREGGAQYNEFYYNIIRDTRTRNQVGGDHNSVYYNIIDTVKNSPVYKSWGTGEGIWIGRSFSSPEYVAHHNKIYNNVIYNTDEAGIKIRSIEREWNIQYNEIKNNIIMNSGKNSIEGYTDIGLYIDYPRVTDNIFQNNLIYNPGVENVVYYRGANMSVEEFNRQNGTKGDTIGGNIQLEAKFADPENHNFALQYSSPAIDMGVDVGLIYDFEGTPVPQGAGVDMGALEFH
jgi:hypothetical protein